jgi:hypothetical protein
MVRSFTGWALDRACEIDAANPGFLGVLFRSSRERRHVIFTYLSIPSPVRTFSDDGVMGTFLSGAGHTEILSAAIGKVPFGLRLCLRRSGDVPHPPRHYRYLCALLASKRRTAMCAVLRRLDQITPERLQIIRALPEPLRESGLVTALRCTDDARDIARLYRLLIRAGVEQAALTQSMSTIRTMAEVRRLVSKWGQRVTFPSHPIPAGLGYTPITNGAMLKESAIRLRNCSRDYIPRVMEQRSAFAIVSHNDVEAMVHLSRSHDGWIMDGLYGSGNCYPDSTIEAWVLKYLARHGVTLRASCNVEREWSCMRRLSGHIDFDTD